MSGQQLDFTFFHELKEEERFKKHLDFLALWGLELTDEDETQFTKLKRERENK